MNKNKLYTAPKPHTEQSPVATGGTVWVEPATGIPTKEKVKLVLEVVLSPILFILIILVVIVTVTVSLGLSSILKHQNEKVRLAIAYEQEYGYSNVEVSGDKAEVTVTQTGEAKEVSAVEYKESVILYETREQLESKMDEVDAGTYEVSYVVPKPDAVQGENE